jgi:hypothetical protein
VTNEELQTHIRAIEGAIAAGLVEHQEGGSQFYKSTWLPIGKSGHVARIKPQPREWFVDPNPRFEYNETHNAFTMRGCGGNTHGLVRVREVIE